MVQEQKDGWIRWRPEIADSKGYEDLAEAIEAFEPPCNEAGEECAEWLKNQSLSEYPSIVTWVMFHNGLVHGFFAISSNVFTISSPHPSGNGEEKKKLPCSQIKWLCKRDQGKFLGRTIFEQAAYTASQVAELQGNVALVIEPFDDTIAGVLEKRLTFLRTAEQGQLWVPLYSDEELTLR